MTTPNDTVELLLEVVDDAGGSNGSGAAVNATSPAPDKIRDLALELRSLLKAHTFAIPEADRYRWANLRERLEALDGRPPEGWSPLATLFDPKSIVRDGYLLLVNADLPRGPMKPFAEWGVRAFAFLSVESWRGMKSDVAKAAEAAAAVAAASGSSTPRSTYAEAKARSMRIRRPTDVRPVRWDCNPDKRWVHLTEDEWIGICEAFDGLERNLMALCGGGGESLKGWVEGQKEEAKP